jgi:O-antigen ligase
LDPLLGGYDASTGEGFRSPSWYVGILALCFAIPYLPGAARLALSCRPLVLLLAAFLTGLAVLGVNAAGGAASVSAGTNVDRPFKSLLMAVLFVAASVEPRWRRRLVNSFVLGWLAFVGLANYLVAAGQAEVVRHFEGVTRRAAFGMNENYMSVIAALGVVLLLDLGIAARRTATRLLTTTAALAGLGVFLFGSSRTALVALSAGVATLAWLKLWPRKRGWLGKAVRTAVVAALLIAAVGFLLRSSHLFSTVWRGMGTRVSAAVTGEDTGKRPNLALATIALALDNPFGVGAGQSAYHLLRDPHNAYLKVIAEGGIVAAGFLAAAALSLFPYIRRAAHAGEDGILAAFAVTVVSGFFGQAFVESPLWFFLALVLTAGGTFPVRPSPRLQGSRLRVLAPRRNAAFRTGEPPRLGQPMAIGRERPRIPDAIFGLLGGLPWSATRG